jgi:tetratricopeptide (TPR) repeat protein
MKLFDALNRRMTQRLAHCDDRYLTVKLVLSCLNFHWNRRWRFRPQGYPRTLWEDIRKIRRLAANTTVMREGEVVKIMLNPVSDPGGTVGDGCHDAILTRILPASESTFFEGRYLDSSWSLFTIELFAGYLKRSGDLASAQLLFEKLIKSHYSIFEGHMGLADIHHLLANWKDEIDEYREVGVYPREAIVAEWKMGDLLWKLDTFDHAGAISHYRQALEIRPGDAFALQQLGRAYLDSGDRQAAAQAYARGARAEPGNALFQFRSAYAQLLAERKGARAMIRKAFRRQPDLEDEFGTIRRVSLRTSREIASRTGQTPLVLTPPCILEGAYTVITDKEICTRNFVLKLEETLAYPLQRARDIGLGCIVTEEKFLISNSKHLGTRGLKMFSPAILLHDGKNAVVGFQKPFPVLGRGKFIILPGAGFNYFHFMFETLSSLLLFSRSENMDDYTILARQEFANYQKELFTLSLGRIPNLRLDDDTTAGALLLETALHLPFPSRFSIPHPAATRLLRERLSKHLSNPALGKRLYITRRQVKLGRTTVNEERISKLLERRGFRPCDPGTMTVKEQIELFKDVEMIVAPGGAALTNLIFCPSQTIVIALASPSHHFECFSAIAAELGQSFVLCASPVQTIPNPFFLWSIFEIEIDIKSLTRALDWATSQVSTH